MAKDKKPKKENTKSRNAQSGKFLEDKGKSGGKEPRSQKGKSGDKGSKGGGDTGPGYTKK